jgi:muconolactone delta-isomerase
MPTQNVVAQVFSRSGRISTGMMDTAQPDSRYYGYNVSVSDDGPISHGNDVLNFLIAYTVLIPKEMATLDASEEIFRQEMEKGKDARGWYADAPRRFASARANLNLQRGEAMQQILARVPRNFYRERAVDKYAGRYSFDPFLGNLG